MAVNPELTNVDRVIAGWGANAPEWVMLMAREADATNQRIVAERIGKSGPYVSRVIKHTYAGDYAEAERLVRATFAAELVTCPIWGEPIPLPACMRNRRRPGPGTSDAERRYLQHCPRCPHNNDKEK